MPTNWDDKLIDKLPAESIDAVYGQAQIDKYGGGRPSLILPPTSEKMIAAHIKKVRNAGMGFNYLLNFSCYENRPFDAEFVHDLRIFMDRLCSYGITAVTATDYFLIKLIKKYYPELKITASIFTMITTVTSAKQYEDIGCSKIIIGSPNDFEFIKNVREAVSCDLVLFANLGCYIFCNECLTHSYAVSHSSQAHHQSKGFYLGHHITRCLIPKVANPESILKMMYVRPEDSDLYESLGVDNLKIADRTFPTEVIVELANSYAKRSYNGNFAKLITAFSLVNSRSSKQFSNIAHLVLGFLSRVNLFKLVKRQAALKPFQIHIDNAELDGMKREIMHKNIKCQIQNCKKCGICSRYFEKAGRYFERSQRELLESLNALLDSISSSDIFKF